MTIKAVIFDLDGTLLNTIEDLKDSVNFALSCFGFPVLTVEQVNSFVGDGVAKLIERSIPFGLSNPKFNECLGIFKKHYENNMYNKTKPYDCILKMLSSLKESGIKTAVVSNKFDLAVRELTKKYFGELIDVSIGECEERGIAKKPSPDMVFEVLKELNLTKDEVLYVGDSDTDILTAKNSGIECISVSWGFREKEFLINKGAKVIIDIPMELIEIIEK